MSLLQGRRRSFNRQVAPLSLPGLPSSTSFEYGQYSPKSTKSRSESSEAATSPKSAKSARDTSSWGQSRLRAMDALTARQDDAAARRTRPVDRLATTATSLKNPAPEPYSARRQRLGARMGATGQLAMTSTAWTSTEASGKDNHRPSSGSSPRLQHRQAAHDPPRLLSPLQARAKDGSCSTADCSSQLEDALLESAASEGEAAEESSSPLSPLTQTSMPLSPLLKPLSPPSPFPRSRGADWPSCASSTSSRRLDAPVHPPCQEGYSSPSMVAAPSGELDSEVLASVDPAALTPLASLHKPRPPPVARKRLCRGRAGPPNPEDGGWKSIQQLKEGEKIFDRFQWSHHAVLQEDGDGGKVVVCQRKGGNTPSFVMKLKAKSSLMHADHFRRNMEWMLNLQPHPGVANVEEVLQDSQYIYTVMERATQGPLLEGLLQRYPSGVIPEAQLRSVIRDVLDGVGFLHFNGILHRDIKPDNMLLSGGDDGSGAGNGSHVMLCDFDHAGPVPEDQDSCTSSVIYGTRRFQAPETFLGKTSRQSDLYSVGTVLYLLVTGQMHFADEIYDGQERFAHLGPRGISQWGEEVFQIMMRQPYKVPWDSESWQSQRGGRSLCQWLLAKHWKERPSDCEEALCHSWMASLPTNSD
eukprot:TRINITY_DN23113_c0_g1_i1.p1 TRINITY_DN23113_c0_g1~~TRINITY_DN23113_c0_g1_i1.p1  ORF type:complete len:640 (-),score=108.84 TRINITY_DN23113_c0_g1_i1:56-1975(-)